MSSAAPRRFRAALIAAGCIGLGAATISLTQGDLAATHLKVKEQTEVYTLPPPAQLKQASLGHRAALADLLWTHVLVTQGLRVKERRRFQTLVVLLEAITELDPEFRRPYLLADALITFQTGETPFEEILAARRIMEKGTVNRPYDAELWLVLGQFVAFIAPGYMKDEAMVQQWRLEGARYLARASELGGGDYYVAWGAASGLGMLNRAGERDAAINMAERALAVTDDPELREHYEALLGQLLSEELLAKRAERSNKLDSIWQRTSSASKTMLDVLGPPRAPAECAGQLSSSNPKCAANWAEWVERVDEAEASVVPKP